MNLESVKKLTYIVNTFILIIVIGLMGFFYLCGAEFLVYFSIPTMVVYLIGYYLIAKDWLYAYVWIVYAWITLYMGLCTICLGYTFGFHLYTLSMIPIIYYTNYMAYKMNVKMIKTWIFSAAILICYLFCTIYVSVRGPVYDASNTYAAIFWTMNSVIVFCFLITYTRILINTIISSEEKLKALSYTDRLTGLYNRHYMMDQLEQPNAFSPTDTIAMIDLDDFKKINDIYGHNAGDYVLMKSAEIMKSTCKDAVISRWGGEEFLILMKGQADAKGLMETLRKSVQETAFTFEFQKIPVSVTIGLAEKNGFSTVDKWVQKADENLYLGKNNGKNQVVE
ncbi:MAG: GGDEF domain-containing protein [Lachnospiraceae bacterium]|nr:GGDEF domain-containing protein [Lachnospiraceae bacterium]